MSKAKWIWYNGDYEIYHHMLLSCRREEKGHSYPCMWHIARPEVSVSFFKEYYVPEDTTIRIVTNADGMVQTNYKNSPVNTDLPVAAGKHTITVRLFDFDTFPTFYIDSEYLKTDETWVASSCDGDNQPVGYRDYFDSPDSDPRVFPFSYENLSPVRIEEVNGGKLYDFGKETFGPTTVKSDNLDGIQLVYGESRKEALDEKDAIINEMLKADSSPLRPARAFRYIFVKCPENGSAEIEAQYEYLPIEDKGSFVCNDKNIEKIWDICAYTFHLNSRECFLDGIKRDRWVWSGDAYQSFKINRYLYNDSDITERTIISLLGKPPYKQHINTINDYSAYLIISVWEHYFATGRIDFLKNVYPKVKALYEFITSRLDKNGYVVRRNGDWIFIDWGVLDKDGAHCAEQILLWQVYNSMKMLASAVGEDDIYFERAEKLRENIIRDYWNEEKGAFIDSFESGKNFVSRQTNVFAVLFGFADKKQTESIIKNVFENDILPQITTPYFKLYELMALCKVGKIIEAQNYINSYWGGMLKLGATSVWEAFDPTQNGDEHLEMYGEPYGKSLCHAWGSGPILLLLENCAGVRPTSIGSKTFEVKPNNGQYSSFNAVVPIRDGIVNIKYSDNTYEVSTTAVGGTFILGDIKTELNPNKKYTFRKG